MAGRTAPSTLPPPPRPHLIAEPLVAGDRRRRQRSWWWQDGRQSTRWRGLRLTLNPLPFDHATSAASVMHAELASLKP
uniref:Uncharacterized protein n=2 Tax=Oryza TaxID=4527 RepID=A0A0E0MRH8_ORYRU